MSSHRSAKKSRSKSLPLWLRSAIVVGLIVLTSALQQVSDTLQEDTGQTEKSQSEAGPIENGSEDWIADSNSLFNRNALSLTQKQSTSKAIAPARLEVGDIIFSGSATTNQGWPRQVLAQLNPQAAASKPYSQVAVVTANASQSFAVYSSLRLNAEKNDQETAEKNAENGTETADSRQVIKKMLLDDYLTQVESGQVVVYRLAIASAQNKTTQNETTQNETSQSTPSKTDLTELAAAIAAAADNHYQKSLRTSDSITAKDTQPAHCSQLIHSAYLAMGNTADTTCFGIEQLKADQRWQQIDLTQAVPAVQSSLD